MQCEGWYGDIFAGVGVGAGAPNANVGVGVVVVVKEEEVEEEEEEVEEEVVEEEEEKEKENLLMILSTGVSILKKSSAKLSYIFPSGGDSGSVQVHHFLTYHLLHPHPRLP